ncbi:MAG: oligosaccharide flippase family protein [Candidatus Nanoarchaeia archaeon]|nr:oligosaccharide flippase family protein [Candidatus Nanoarchaeia archaeon]
MKETINDIKNIFSRTVRRDFSGNTGIVIKNSIFQFLISISTKIGSLLFTAIIARMLMPELFGLYSLALSVILIFSTLSELGIGETIVRFVSKELGRDKKITKAKDYTLYLGKLKLFLALGSTSILMIAANFISNIYYQKPIFLALIAGSLYILFLGISGFLKSVVLVSNYFNGLLYHEIAFQATRLVVVPLLIFLSLKKLASTEVTLMFIIIGLSFSFLVPTLLLLFLSRKKVRYLAERGEKITSSEKRNTLKFIIPTAATVITTIVFGSIDMVMLGKFVLSQYIGYYRAAYSLIAAIFPLISFSVVLLPTFSRLGEQQLEKGFKKSASITFLLSLALLVFVFLFSPLIIRLIYGNLYEPSINLLRVFSLLFISVPVMGVYVNYFTAKGKPFVVTKILIGVVILNILLNLLAIFLLRSYGDLAMVYGVTIATILSSWAYTAGLALIKKRNSKV